VPRITRGLDVEQIVIAIPSLQPERLREILKICEETNLPVRLLPPLRELMGSQLKGKVEHAALREVRMEDLLPRPEVKLDPQMVSAYLSGKTVLVTGGGGSIGGELCRQAVAAGVHRLLVLGRGENSVFEMVQELSELDGSCEIIPVICDVRDRTSLLRIFQRFTPHVVFHAGAHKHVPLMEQYPCEAVKNNVLGTLNVVELALEHQVESFVMVSTDKAVEPCNVMGATKHLCEMIVNGYAAHSGANMVSVRFGNVLGSRGSVVPTMRRQISRRLPVTITDPDMVRFFMTIPEAVQLILQAGAIGGQGEVFVLDMGRPVKILDLAYDLIRLSGLVPNQDIPIRIIGRRPGEKMHEDILTSSEASGASKNGPFYMATSRQVILPELLEQIERLRVASEAGDEAQIRSIIQKLIPEFCPDSIAQNGNALANGAHPEMSAR
ncbi:MAG TPA: nucleoside-diphosphate sugar epimerase/dehydratase, partial [Abditibacteriaceae bacterium]|nr:nucleoside-diphosphate sugar epimerase/dehydratase [Abditibacteriaceae bacterium]